MTQELKTLLEVMTVELGEKNGGCWCATFSVKDVILRIGKKNIESE